MGIKFTKIVKEDKGLTSPPLAQASAIREGIPVMQSITQDENSVEVEEVGESRVRTPKVVSFPVSVTPEQPNEEVKNIPKKRGRKPGSTNKTVTSKKGMKSVASIETLTRQVEGFHAILDVMFPGSAIEHDMAKIQAEAIKGVLDAYDIQISEKATALFALISTTAIVELPVMKNIMHQLKQKAVKKRATVTALKQRQSNIPIDDTTAKSDRSQASNIPVHSNDIFSHQTNEIAVGEPNAV